jgi:AAA ATPase domain
VRVNAGNMLLQSIQIKNYRSIEDITFDIKPLDDSSYTFGLIGVNEAGKSSILKAMALKDSIDVLTQKDFKDKTKSVEVLFKYKLDINDDFDAYNKVAAGESPPTVLSSGAIQPDDIVVFKLSFSPASPSVPIYEFLHSRKKFDLAISVTVTKAFFDIMHRTVFWTAKNEYLISDAINLTEFALKPESSIPLKNSFGLAGIGVSHIPQAIANFNGDTTEKKHLEETLSEAVTGHISKVWPGHPIKIVFDIDGQIINFHVMDTKAKGKAKTADQRSDGFKQFISFLLTVSAEDSNEELNNCLLLLDEPETHLHPQAQIYFLDELKKITTNDRGNIVLFATHSNYMIDKDKLIRNFKILRTQLMPV